MRAVVLFPVGKKGTLMGIKNLNKLLTEICPNVFKKTSLTEFKGQRIGIDANQFATTTMARAHARVVDTTDVAVSRSGSRRDS